jgi:uncharacterized protein YqcC (DUF446 family)
MSVASAAILASAIRPKSERQGSGPKTVGESVVQKPIQWLIVAGVVGYIGYKLLKDVVKTGDEKKQEGAETAGTNNPFAFEQFLDWTKVPKGTKVLEYNAALARARQIYNALDVVAYENEDIVVGVFTSLPSQIQVAQVAKAFYDNFGKDVLTYIQQGNKTFNFFTGGLSTENYNRIIQNVARKPKF